MSPLGLSPPVPGLSMASLEMRTAEERQPPCLQSLPVEIRVKIFESLDIKDALHLAQTNRQMRAIYQSHTFQILRNILAREFGPLDALLRVTDLSLSREPPFGTWLNPRLSFGGTLVSNESSYAHLPEIRFKHEHLPQIMEVVKTVTKWERAFPRLRFAELAGEERRSLRHNEKERLRSALYAWWRYSHSYHAHHANHDVRETFYRTPEFLEIRMKSLRALSAVQLYELKDLWKTVRGAVTTQLCPSYSLLLASSTTEDIDPLSEIDNNYLNTHSWEDGPRNDWIVGNVLRLAPDQLISLLDHVACYPTAERQTLAAWMKRLHNTVELAYESLSHTLERVIAERVKEVVVPVGEKDVLGPDLHRFVDEYGFPGPWGGVLDCEAGGKAETLRRVLAGGEAGWFSGDGMEEGDREVEEDSWPATLEDGDSWPSTGDGSTWDEEEDDDEDEEGY